MESKLTKKYGLFTAMAMVVGVVIGSGIFFKTEAVLGASGGSAVIGILALLIVGVIMIICSYTFSVMAGRYDKVNGLVDYAEAVVGHGYAILDCNGYKIMVINAMGNVHIEPQLDNPYSYIDRALTREAGRYDFAVLDIHAEATGEKVALGYAYDGKISVVFGTHTHVPTCDEMILPRGTGYISDIGMCGESGGVLGMNPELVVKQMRSRAPIRFEAACGSCKATGVIFDVDANSGKVTKIERLSF